MAGEGPRGKGIQLPAPPSAVSGECGEEMLLLGEALKAGVEDVLAATIAHTAGPEHDVEAVVQDAFERIGRSSTIAVARWICGETMEVAIEAGRETWEIFGELAVHRAASLDEVTWRCFWWRNAMVDALRSIAAELEVSDEALSQALNILQLSLEFSLLRMCECFEAERQRTDEALERREEELAFLATHDALTGLPNRTLILDRTEQMLARSRRAQTPAAALFIDLDNFKDINDTLGHGAGDELLQAVAARLEAVTREADALGRLGGDEFVVISEELSLAAGPELVAERLLEALAPPFQLGPKGKSRVSITASIGIAMAEDVSAEDLLRNADIAMYRAKWDGRNRYAVFEADMQETLQKRMELEMDLRDAFGAGRVLPRLPADARPQQHAPHRGRGAAALAPPDARRPAAEQLHPAARGDGADRRGRQVGARRSLPPGRRLARGGARDQHGGQRLRSPARLRRDHNRHRIRARGQRPRPQGADDRGDRDDPDAERRGDRRAAGQDQGRSGCRSRSTTSAPATPRSPTCSGSPSTR